MAVLINGLTKRYGGSTVVDGLDLHACDGRVTGFLGRNGAGKSTTLRCLAGLARPDAGTATVDGEPFDRLDDPVRRVGVALDPEAHHPARSGRHHLLALTLAARLPAERVSQVLTLVELDAAADRPAGGYSLGMRQRLHLAAALLGDPGTLVLDEPANGLDPQGIRWLRDLLRALAAEGRCVLLSSHQLGEVAQTVDDVVVIAEGRLVTAGSLSDVLGADRGVVRLRSPRAATLAPLLELQAEVSVDGEVLRVTGLAREDVARVAHEADVLVTELADEQPDLEATFFRLTAGAAA